MAHSTEPEDHNGPVVSPKAAAPPEAETRLTPEISAPMLDVHPPHESIHTWRSFFIHIATIVVGLLIAWEQFPFLWNHAVWDAAVTKGAVRLMSPTEANHHQEFYDLMATMSSQSLTDWDAINAARRFDLLDSDPTHRINAAIAEMTRDARSPGLQTAHP
jgi:hypothetical protein